MKAPVSWLNQFLPKPQSAEAIANALERGGIEVEQIISAQKFDEQIIIAEVKKVMQHPNADKLKLATIDTGKKQITLVCGAPNLKVGMKVAYAQVGSKLPDGTKIAAAQIRGETSQGMLCSSKELGLNDDHSGLLALDSNLKLGQKLSNVLPSDEVVDVTTQANRFDLLSIAGLAREVAAQTNQAPKQLNEIDLKISDANTAEIVAAELVHRYQLARIRLDLKRELPRQITTDLISAGVRSISPIVDLTNYVMLEIGQPLHAFDADKVKLPITIRLAKAGERLTTLDGITRSLTNKDLVIADKSGPIALAGVMGGAATEVTSETTEILLESASFDGATVRKMAQRHGLRSEASARFERNLVPHLAQVGLGRAIELMQDSLAGQVLEISDQPNQVETQLKLTISPGQISNILSITVTASDLAKVLPKLGFKVETGPSQVTVTVPWWRSDVALAEDLAEEYIRLVGYDVVPARLPKWQPEAVVADQFWPRLWETKSILKGLGLFEVITYSFVSKEQLEQFGYKLSDHLKLKNPLSQEQAYLRQSLLPSLLTATIRNQSFAPRFALYEVSQVFFPTRAGQQPKEPRMLGAIFRDRDNSYSAAKAALDRLSQTFRVEIKLIQANLPEFMPGMAAKIEAGGKVIGRIGQLHPKYLGEFKSKTELAYIELELETLWAGGVPPTYRAISRFPSLYRDLTVVVSQKVWWQDLASTIEASQLAKPSFLNDYYGDEVGNGKKAVAIRLEMSSLAGTLTDKEADERLAKIEALLLQRFSAHARS